MNVFEYLQGRIKSDKFENEICDCKKIIHETCKSYIFNEVNLEVYAKYKFLKYVAQKNSYKAKMSSFLLRVCKLASPI